MVARLTDSERADALEQRPLWRASEGRDAIERSLRFADFGAAFAFMTQVALAAEKADHHPEWFNVWNRVDVTLTTHDADGLSARDLALADTIDRIAAAMGAA